MAHSLRCNDATSTVHGSVGEQNNPVSHVTCDEEETKHPPSTRRDHEATQRPHTKTRFTESLGENASTVATGPCFPTDAGQTVVRDPSEGQPRGPAPCPSDGELRMPVSMRFPGCLLPSHGTLLEIVLWANDRLELQVFLRIRHGGCGRGEGWWLGAFAGVSSSRRACDALGSCDAHVLVLALLARRLGRGLWGRAAWHG